MVCFDILEGKTKIPKYEREIQRLQICDVQLKPYLFLIIENIERQLSYQKKDITENGVYSGDELEYMNDLLLL